MTLEIPVMYVKDKQAFTKKNGVLRLLGNPVFVAKDFSKKGTKLIHIVDEDAKKGMATNLDIYDKLTYFINVEVECGEKEPIVEKLLGMKARVVLRLPTRLDLSRWKENEKLLVGLIGSGYKGKAEGVHDVIIEEANEEKVKRFKELGKRVIVHEKQYRKLEPGNRKLIFGVMLETT